MTLPEFFGKYEGEKVDFSTMLAYNGGMELPVSSPKYGTHSVLIDDKDSDLIPRGVYLHKVGHFLYVRRKPDKKYLHRLIMGEPTDMIIDHLDRNPLNNKRDNLRVTTVQGNLRNQRRQNNKTGITGVSVHRAGGFEASIKVNYKKIYLGYFKTINKAKEARIKAERRYWKV